ncbi:MAG: hypothetical protein JSR76_05320 [Verrucomicrobia bacterium]|nr:hypothetical protein [Verrucomicrobiota bacterium]
MIIKFLSIFFFMGTFASGYAAENTQGDYPSWYSVGEEEDFDDSDEDEKTWDDGRPMSDWEYEHIDDVYLGGD